MQKGVFLVYDECIRKAKDGEVTEVMGGKVLNYRSKEIYLEGMKEGIAQLVTRKYQLGDSPEKIAKDLLMREEEVEEILGKVVSEKVE